jgi:hypothetical protein
MRHRPSRLRNPIVKRNWRFSFSPLRSVLTHRPTAVAKATSCPAVISMSSKSNATGFGTHPKNRSHVAIYASRPRDKNGGGTSNIRMSGSWSTRIPARSSSRTAFDHRAINPRSATSSFVGCFCSPVAVIVSPSPLDKVISSYSPLDAYQGKSCFECESIGGSRGV